jgi:hypothetical protein
MGTNGVKYEVREPLITLIFCVKFDVGILNLEKKGVP